SRPSTWSTCGAGEGCKGSCNSPKANSTIDLPWSTAETYGRGQEITVKWHRANHPGGFVQLAMVDMEQSNDWNAFNSNVIKHVCYESNCGPDAPVHDQFGPGNGPGDGICWAEFKVPSNFQDGQRVTLQWIWYGGGVYYGDKLAGFGKFYNCADFRIQGGDALQSNYQAPPVFEGGDYSNPNSIVCKYWASNKVGDCTFGARMPTPKEGDLLSQSLEPYARGESTNGAPVGF
ncbi:hypothetical protein H4R34_005823, partial [Dimargaris verticillata]